MYPHDNVSVTLPLTRNLVSALKGIYDRSNREAKEYCGSSYFDGFKFVAPTCMTDRCAMSVRPTSHDAHQYLVYHTHVVPPWHQQIFTLPSRDDIELFLFYYPMLQQNLILEKHGYYLIDFMANGLQKPTVDAIMDTFDELKKVGRFCEREVRVGDCIYYYSDRDEWKFAVSEMNKVLTTRHGLNMRFHAWDELGVVTLFDHDFLT